ncbi:MAG TPA: ATP-dependent helicase, partial [Pseudoxanthomonas sp.]|nr:ATP-dependent helicase [Pseudoxanthomonas sp.]
AADPANLLGTVLAGAKIPRVPGSSVVYRDGVAIAASAGGQTQWLVELGAPEQRQTMDALVQRSAWKPSSAAETAA